MTTPQPAALPEPFAWAWHNKVTGAKGVYFEDPQPFGVTSHPDYEWTHLYNEAQVIAALQSQPAAAGVSDAEIIAIKKATKAADPTQPWGDTLAFARAILALRPQSESEPFGYFRATPDGWEDCSEHDEGAKALYERPQAVPMTEDTARLDWLGENPACKIFNEEGEWSFDGKLCLDLRDAIDNARGITAQGGEAK